MGKIYIISIMTVFAVTVLLNATVINIPDDYAAIQAGIDASSNGDTVLVQPGEYVENINFNGHNIVLGSLFFTTGDQSYIEQTVIDGDSAGSVVTFESGEGYSAIIEGFVISHGFAAYGGGIRCRNSNPTISNNIIKRNYSVVGGGIYSEGDSPKLTNNLIMFNQANGIPRVNEGKGGGLFCYNSNIIVWNNTFYGNKAHDDSIYNVPGKGGGIYCYGSDPHIVNTIFWEDSARFEPHEYYFIESDPTIIYSNIQGIIYSGEGNISINPLFRNPNSGDFHLMAIECGDAYNSPCIDAGDTYRHDVVLNCDWGLGTERSDVGAYGGWAFTNRYIIIPNHYHKIQLGINNSQNGDTILVLPGTYIENIDLTGHTIVLGSMFMLENDTNYISSTIIDGNRNGPVINIGYGSDSTCIIGFTLNNGLSPWGGGIKCINTCPKICFNYINDNIASNGGGLYIAQSRAKIYGNKFQNNNASFGAGVYTYRSDLKLFDNYFNGNTSSTGGGGIYCSNFSPEIYNNTFILNHAASGGGVYLAESAELHNNSISDNSATNGGGIYCSETSSPIIYENTIVHNGAITRGGAIYCLRSNAVISNNSINENFCDNFGGGIFSTGNNLEQMNEIFNNKIQNNFARIGGGIYNDNFYDTFYNNTIIGNSSQIGGGYYGRGNIYYCDIAYNYAEQTGGGLVINSSSTILGNTIHNNNAQIGGGLYVTGTPLIENNTIYKNIANSNGGGLYFSRWYATLNISNTVFWYNFAEDSPQIGNADSCWINIRYSDIDGGYYGYNNIDLDPMFVCADTGDFHLLPGSPCIDTGDPNSPLDPDSTRADMGALYYNQLVNIDDLIKQLTNHIALFQNYPNPFNASTVIKYELPRRSQVTIEIYDILGRKASTLIDKQQPAGYHQAIWRADDFSSGMYFYKLQAGDYTETKKMLLLK